MAAESQIDLTDEYRVLCQKAIALAIKNASIQRKCPLPRYCQTPPKCVFSGDW